MLDQLTEHSAIARILICDDEITPAEELARTLKQLGYQVVGSVSSGEEAVRAAEQLKPDLVLTDIELKGEIDGIEAAGQIRSRMDIPVVYLGVYTQKNLLERAKRTEPYGYLGKPVQSPVLRSTIETALYEHEVYRDVRQSEKRHRLVLEHAGVGIGYWDLEGTLLFINRVGAEQLNGTPEEFLGKNLFDLFQRSTAREYLGRIREVAECKSSREYEDSVPLPSGDKWFLSSYAAVTDGAGQVAGVQIISQDITDRKNGEMALRETSRLNQILIDSMPCVALLLRPRSREIIASNAEAVKVGAVPGAQCFSSWAKREEPCPWCLAPKLWETGEAQHLEVETRGKVYDAHWIPVSSDLYMHYAFDVTEQRRAEAMLKTSKERLSLALAGANLGIWEWDLTTGKALWDERTHRVLGYEPNQYELNLKNWKRLVHPEDWPRVSENLNLHIEGRLPTSEVEYRMLNKSGDWQWVLARGNVIAVDPEGKPTRLTGVFADIAERKKAEEGLQNQVSLMESLLEAIPTPVFFKSTDHTYLGCNEAFAEFTGRPKEKIIGKSVFEVVPKEAAEVYRLQDERLFKNPGTQVYEISVEGGDGEMHDTIVNKATFADSSGAVAGLIGVVVDITDRKKAEAEQRQLRDQLFQAQKMEAVGTLAGGIAHDFNNLLTIINGYTELILSEKTEDDPSYADLEKILETGRKGAELVQRLLALSKKGEHSTQPLDLNRGVEDAVVLMQRTFPKMIEIDTALEKDLGMVRADSSQVEQVLMNLCINAKEAMPEGGRIRIETRNSTVDEEYCRLNPGAEPGQHVLIEISDTGTGMSEETLERVFDPFFTTKGWDFRKGTGLGLSVAKGIVEQHGGWITCESEQSKGTTFRLYFPTIEDVQEAKRPEAATETAPKGERILLIDDEDFVRDLGKRILERAGHTVITAANGKEALEIYERERSTIALVVLDLIMPQMGGEKCLEDLLKIDPKLKVIVSTGHSLSQSERDRLGALAKGFANKPYRVQEFLEVVREVHLTP